MKKVSANLMVDERIKKSLKIASALMGCTTSRLVEGFIKRCGQEKYLESCEALKGKNLDPDFEAFHKQQRMAYEAFNDIALEDYEAEELAKKGGK